jgi:hypothetical protein
VKVENKKVPEKEGFETLIHICSKCKNILDCYSDGVDYGWCYTYEKNQGGVKND